jgi:hypothetical protein
MISDKIGELSLTEEIFYLRARDGGFPLYSLHDHNTFGKIVNLAHLQRRSSREAT